MARYGYGMNIRPIYDEGEPTAGDYLSRGVSGAIDAYLKGRDERRAEDEAARQEENQFATQGFKPVPRGEEALAPPPRMQRGPETIGKAIGFTLHQPSPGEGYESVRSRSGQTFRRPDAVARTAQEEARQLAAYKRKEEVRVAGEKELIPLRNAKPRLGQTQAERIELERLRQQGRLAVQAVAAGRGNSAMQLRAAQAVQASLDANVRALQAELRDARRAYDDERVRDLLEAINEARDAAEENRAALERAGQMASPRRRPAHPPEDEAAVSSRRDRRRVAPRMGPRTPTPKYTPSGSRTVPPPVGRP